MGSLVRPDSGADFIEGFDHENAQGEQKSWNQKITRKSMIFPRTSDVELGGNRDDRSAYNRSSVINAVCVGL